MNHHHLWDNVIFTHQASGGGTHRQLHALVPLCRPRPGSTGPVARGRSRDVFPFLLAVHDLIFWRDVKKTGFVFGTTLIVLLSLAAFSVISVVSYLILALLSVTIGFRVYKSVIQAVQKSEEGHPFK